MDYSQALQALLSRDPLRMQALTAVHALHLSDGWIGAGFVRDAVWAHLHGHPYPPMPADVDVVWFDDKQPSAAQDLEFEETLKRRNPTFNWSVKNQARMHQRNGDAPYHSTEHALGFWPETATAVAVRLAGTQGIEIVAPYGLEDLFELRLKPTPRFEHEKYSIFTDRVAEKRWLQRYPSLRIIERSNPIQPINGVILR
ncbi:TPA: nucleotidyltransferase family protein [Kluyvera ascorbata]|nr:nucleotidyltransferase family protein [Kluyvera ascorbata]